MIAIIRVARPLTCLLAGIILFSLPKTGQADGVVSLDPDFDVKMQTVAGISAAAKQSDGKILVVGNFNSINGKPARVMARLNSDGSVDESFELDESLEFPAPYSPAILKVAVQSDDKIICSRLAPLESGEGYYTEIFRLLPDGEIDESFLNIEFGGGISGIGLYDVSKIKVQEDDRVIVVGDFRSVNDTGISGIVRLLRDGEIDSSFTSPLGESGINVVGSLFGVTDCFTQDDGKLLISHRFDSVIGSEALHLTRLNSDGSVDPGFKLPFFETLDYGPRLRSQISIYEVTKQVDGTLFLAGSFTLRSEELEPSPVICGLLKFGPDNHIDLDYMYNGSVVNSSLNSTSMYVLEDSRVFLLHDRATLLATDGSLDETFSSTIGSDIRPSFLVFQSNGDFIIGGSLQNGATLETSIVQMHIDGSLNSQFDCLPVASSVIERLLQLMDGKTVIHGNFPTINGVPAGWLARLNSDGSLDETFELQEQFSNSGRFEMSEHPDGRFFVEGSKYRNNQLVRDPLAFLPDGQVDDDFALGVTFSNTSGMIIDSEGNILVLGTPAGNSKRFLYRFLSDGQTDATFTIVEFSIPFVVWTVLADGGILIGKGTVLSTKINGIEVESVVRLNSDGTIDSEFEGKAVPNGTVSAFAVQPDGKVIISGDFDKYNGETVGRLIRIFPDGTRDDSFQFDGPELNSISKILVSESGDIFLNSSPPTRVFKDGKVDPFFKIETPPNFASYDIAIRNDQELLLAGVFSEIEGSSRDGLARLIIDDSKVFMTLPQVEDQSVDFQFNSEEGKSYSIEYQDAINGEWSGLETGVTGNGSLRTVSDLDPVSAQRIYRVTTE